ncbi:MAG TPA: AAA family ATPase [Rhodanobacteraceae bacterium]|nr:AAA family ATPase [Rhodanobacteraceae bacterium]
MKRSHLLTGCTSDEPLELRDGLADMLLSPRFDGARLLRSLVRLAPPAALSLVDFAHVHELDLVTRYMREVLARRRTGVNVLLYGEPGTGKTEFVRVLAATLGTELYEVPNSDDDDEAISGKERFQSYSICQELLGGERGRMLLFDEVEDVFGSGDWSIFSQLFGGSGRGGRDAESLRKSWINQTLESNPVPAVWVCNSIGAMDPAYLRRFDLAVEFRRLTRTARRRMIDRHFRRGEISAQCAERLAEVDALTPAALERTARVLRSLHTRSASQRDAEAEQIVTTSLRASGYHRQLPKPVLPAHYDPAFLRCDADLDGIVRGLKRGGSARLCLYGPPGTGKSAFAHHLGRELDRPVLVRRASDLLGKYIGETEKALRRAFEQARDDQAILLIDEADGFLRDRRGAERSWEVSQVNELLTQMEAFDGIFVASTNLLDMLDAAALRRFDFKLKFDAMDRAQRRAMLLRVADTADDTDAATRAACAAIERLEHVTPGDFANVLRQLRLTRDPASAARVVELLRAEVAMKPRAGRPIGFV